MDEKTLLKSMTDIEDKYIEGAADAAGVGTEKKKAKAKKKFSYKPWIGALAAVFALCIGIGTIGMNRGMSESVNRYASKSSSTQAEYSEPSYSGEMSFNGFASEDMAVAEAEGYDLVESKSMTNQAAPSEAADEGRAAGGSAGSTQLQQAETKLVKRANISIQTTEFEETKNQMMALVTSMGGYVEYSDVSNGSWYYSNNMKNGYFTVRVPADKYDLFVNGVTENCHVSSISESVEDIGQQYFDTEMRLKTLKTKLARLQELLAQAKDLSDIITLESEISNTEYQIDNFTSTLNRYDSLVGYSTITVNIQEVSRVGDTVTQNPSFWSQLVRSLKNGILSFFDGIGDIILWAAYNAIGIIIIIGVIVFIRKKHLIRRLIDSIRGRKTTDQNEE